ncbi:hypothetical protein [Saccharopolyspora tripterygii]
MAEPKNRHDEGCEVWTGDGSCTCHFVVGDRVRVRDRSDSGRYRGKSGEVLEIWASWSEYRAIVALGELTDTDMPERIFSQNDLEKDETV